MTMIRKAITFVRDTILALIFIAPVAVPFITGVSLLTVNMLPNATLHQQIFVGVILAIGSLLLATPAFLFWFIGSLMIVTVVFMNVWVLLG